MKPKKAHLRVMRVCRLPGTIMKEEDWHGPAPVALLMEDGTYIYPSQDDEGNGPGALFGRSSKGHPFRWG